jgi:hypothetical protein
MAAPPMIGAQPPASAPSGIGVGIEQTPEGHVVVTRVLPRSPAVAAEYQGLPTTITAARASFEYEQQGRQFQEDVYAVVAAVQMQAFVNWLPHTSFSFHADKAELAQRARLFRTVVASLTPNPRWYNRYLQLVDACARAAIDASNQAAVRSRIIAQTNDRINAIRRQAIDNRNASQLQVWTNRSGEYLLSNSPSYTRTSAPTSSGRA